MKILSALKKRSFSLIKLLFYKYILRHNIYFELESLISLSTIIKLDKTSTLKLGKKVGTRRNVEFSAKNSAEIHVGNKCFFNNNCMIVSHKYIFIDEHCEFGPNVLIYDHDHDYRASGGLKSGEFKSEEISIGKNVWVGANSIILRGTTIGDNCVIAAGSIVKGVYPENTLIVNKRNEKVINY